MVICFFTGIEGDIYYIRDGQIKLNAVNLNMTVPYRVNCLRFIWFSKPVVSIFNTIWRSRCSVFEYNYKHSLNGKVMLLYQLVCQCFNHPPVDHALSGNVMIERDQTYYLFSMRFYGISVEPLLISLMNILSARRFYKANMKSVDGVYADSLYLLSSRDTTIVYNSDLTLPISCSSQE